MFSRFNTTPACDRQTDGQTKLLYEYRAFITYIHTYMKFITRCIVCIFADLIVTLANLSFSKGAFPSIFKTAVVTPRLKKAGSDPDSLENYRPICNLNNISKILERLFLGCIQQHITTCANFNQFQSAYRPQYSTETTLLYTLNNIYSSADRSQPTLLVSLDLSATFDTIDHKILINRLPVFVNECCRHAHWRSLGDPVLHFTD